jgi:hypothetical protein
MSLVQSWDSRLDDLEVFNPPVAVTSFPVSPVDYQRAIRSDLGYTDWTWNPLLGLGGEWQGPSWNENFGNTTQVTNAYMRRGDMAGTAATGAPLAERARITRITGNWVDLESGTLEFRVNGVAAGRTLSYTTVNNFIFVPPLNTSVWLVGPAPGAAVQAFCPFVISTTGNIQNPQLRIEGFYTRLQSE